MYVPLLGYALFRILGTMRFKNNDFVHFAAISSQFSTKYTASNFDYYIKYLCVQKRHKFYNTRDKHYVILKYAKGH